MPFDSMQPSSPGTISGVQVPTPQTKSIQTLCTWGGANNGVNPTPVLSTRLSLLSGSVPGASTWWLVDVRGRELVTLSAEVVTQTARALGQIRETGVRGSKLKCRVGWMTHGGGGHMIFDIGGGARLSVQSPNVQVDVVGPDDLGIARGGGGQAGGGTVLNTEIVGSVSMGCAPIGKRGVTLTLTRQVAAAGVNIEPIPDGCEALEIFAPDFAGANPLGSWAETQTGVGILGQLRQLTIAAGRSGVVSRPGSASSVISTNDDIATRFYTYVFHLAF